MLTVQEIRKFIDQDAASDKKRKAQVGLDYYENKTDIQHYRIFYIDADGVLREDKTKCNFRISHPFFKLIVDQEAQYILSGEGAFIKSDIPELQTELDEYFNENENFKAELSATIVGAVTKGWDFMYAYKGKHDRTAFSNADSMGVIEVRARDTEDKCEYIILWYIDRIDRSDKVIKRIQVWNDTQTAYFCQVNDGDIELDKSIAQNPRPHIIWQKDGSDEIFYDDYGVIPFFRLDNGKKQQSGILPIKGLIDSYELMNCGLVNNIQDTNEALYVVKGFQGDNLDELMMNIKAKKHIGVDEDGGVDIKTIDIPVEARKTKMEIDEKNIFRFGMGVNTEGLKDTSATTSIAIKSAYANLDLKCDGFMPYLYSMLRKMLDVVLKEINAVQGSNYEQKDVYFDFDRQIITNEQESAQIKLTEAQEQQTRVSTILNVFTQLGQEIATKMLCEALELDYDDIKGKLPKPEEDPYATKTAIDAIQTEGPVPDGGGVIE